MPRAGLDVTEELIGYLGRWGARTDDVLERVRAETAAMPSAQMQVTADQGALIELLVRLIGAKDALEVGTFTGYSAICIARGLAEGGRLTCLELDEERAAIARRNIDAAGVGDRLRVHRRRQGRLPRVLRARPRADAPGRAHAARQHAPAGARRHPRERDRPAHRRPEPAHPRGRARRRGDDDRRRRLDVRARSLSVAGRYAAAANGSRRAKRRA